MDDEQRPTERSILPTDVDGPSESTDAADDALAAAGLETDLDVRGDDVVVVGHDGWTPAVLDELVAEQCDVTVVCTDDDVAETLRSRAFDVVLTEDVDEASLRTAGVEAADTVLVATLDEQRNVLAILTVMNVDPSVHVATFAAEAEDVPKLRSAGADTVVSLGAMIGELLVEVALTDRSVADVVAELTERGR